MILRMSLESKDAVSEFIEDITELSDYSGDDIVEIMVLYIFHYWLNLELTLFARRLFHRKHSWLRDRIDETLDPLRYSTIRTDYHILEETIRYYNISSVKAVIKKHGFRYEVYCETF